MQHYLKNLHENNNLSVLKSMLNCDNLRIFYHCCEYGYISSIKYLIAYCNENNISFDIHAENENGFVIACTYGQFEVVKFLYEYCNSINSPININIDMNYPLFRSCLSGHMEIGKYLIQKCNKKLLNDLSYIIFICCYDVKY